MQEKIIEIAEQYLLDNKIDTPHFMCQIVCQGLSLRLQEMGIDCRVITVDVDMTHFNGFTMPWEKWDIVEHHVIKIGSKILDATASQFDNMPRVYYGSRPMWYR